MRLDRRLVNAGRRGPGNDWFKLVNQGSGTADLWIYDEIGYWGTTAADVVSVLSQLDVTAINLHVNSLGGEVFDGMAIYECLRVHPADITTYVDGVAASIASVIAMAGNKIVMGRNAQMMIHNASGGCWGTADDMDVTAKLLRSVTANIAGVYADRTGQPVEHWLTAMAAETWYFGHEAVTAGLADELAPMHKVPGKTDPDEPDMPMEDRLSIFRFAGRAQAPPPVLPTNQTPPLVDGPDSGTRPVGGPPPVGDTPTPCPVPAPTPRAGDPEPPAVPDPGPVPSEIDFNDLARLLKEAFQ